MIDKPERYHKIQNCFREVLVIVIERVIERYCRYIQRCCRDVVKMP